MFVASVGVLMILEKSTAQYSTPKSFKHVGLNVKTTHMTYDSFIVIKSFNDSSQLVQVHAVYMMYMMLYMFETLVCTLLTPSCRS